MASSTSFSLHSKLFSRRFTANPPPHSPITLRSSLRISAGYATAEISRTASQAASCYDVLGIDAGATFQEIKSAYRKLARTLHPDVANKGGETADEFIRVHAAYSTLSDPEKRAVYDNSLSWRRRPATVTPRGRSWETDQCW
ncbi:chaperone protein dnaJ 11, chloroplastic-like [Salvia miltiorrhiza]|uniref:chaperone protein dnaJ 11, chloroplastic-like n=1 Tax=Salvia miltiorrhiza TaxID=226208 RepID=UPI0025AD11E4|nr:chaperone protein dnaJ 11, chloroplastic-like [Salvia miltiorrhiza]